MTYSNLCSAGKFIVTGDTDSSIFVAAGGAHDMVLCFVSCLNTLIERLQDARIHRRDHIDRGIQLFFRHPRFPCVRKAPLHSRIAQPHHRYGKPH